ncbi:hypothetical protein Pelo_3980 [Pelomyxa schiedti]|nr:hypothetical protein Pelo_3980 [Pelomyxa schiedti]
MCGHIVGQYYNKMGWGVLYMVCVGVETGLLSTFVGGMFCAVGVYGIILATLCREQVTALVAVYFALVVVTVCCAVAVNVVGVIDSGAISAPSKGFVTATYFSFDVKPVFYVLALVAVILFCVPCAVASFICSLVACRTIFRQQQAEYIPLLADNK